MRPALKPFANLHQLDPELFGRWQRDPEPCEFLVEAGVDGFFKIDKAGWGEISRFLSEGRFYVQNPAASIAPTMLAKRFAGGRVLDLCSAPGGKALLTAHMLGGRMEELVAVDLPGPRFERLVGNVERYREGRIKALAGDVMELSREDVGDFEAVLLDAPCSNSGVLQHKVDARWRMDRGMLEKLIELQLKLLQRASSLVAAKGLLIYSTCSVDRSENEELVELFLKSESGSGFEFEEFQKSLPWISNQDGAGVAVLRRR